MASLLVLRQLVAAASTQRRTEYNSFSLLTFDDNINGQKQRHLGPRLRLACNVNGRPGPNPLITVVMWAPTAFHQSPHTSSKGTNQLATEQKTSLLKDSEFPTAITSNSKGFAKEDKCSAARHFACVLRRASYEIKYIMTPATKHPIVCDFQQVRPCLKIWSNQVILTWKGYFWSENTTGLLVILTTQARVALDANLLLTWCCRSVHFFYLHLDLYTGGAA